MGRQKERARRRRGQRERMSLDRPVRGPGLQTPAAPWSRRQGLLWGVVAIIVVVVAVVAARVSGLSNSSSPGSATAAPSVAPATAPPFNSGAAIDGIPCMAEMLTYHVHAHLTILDAGKSIVVPANTGISYTRQCLYWLHTHDTSGVIHIEAPHKVSLHLGNFFDIWGQPLSRTKVATATVSSGQRMVVWVNGKKYPGNPRTIPLTGREDIAVVIGPPFPHPKPYNFSGL